MNIPIYRAKKIDSDEYVEGIAVDNNLLIQCTHFDSYYNEHIASVVEIDPTTLAIHFKDMIDSEGNKIFASLSKNGKGGDIMKDDEYYGIAKYKDSSFVVEYENVEECLCEGNFEIIGIHK